MTELKDNIDFGREDVASLFRKMLYPTLLGMMFAVLFTITDGIFVGRGIGSDALAAVNIVAPLFLLSTGIGLMFGMGASVVASIHLSYGKVKAARINMTQAIVASSLILLTCSTIIMIFPDETLRLFGCSERLAPLAKSYLMGFVPFLVVNGLICSGGFFIRLDGAPNYSMICTIVATVLNIILDYLFIFVLNMGILGAALATGIGTIVGVSMMILYLSKKRNLLHFVKVKLSTKSMRLTIRNVVYMCKLGFSSFLCELAIACMMICGNYVFMREIGEDGVAAFSIACYFFPILFMIYTSITESAQPIISYNYGANNNERVYQALKISLKSALCYGAAIVVITALFRNEIVSMFLDSSAPAHAIAANGFPIFAIGFIPFAVNMIAIGYYQSVEQVSNANIITMLRGFIFMIACFIVAPMIWGEIGVWLAVPISEALTFVFVIMLYLLKRHRRQSSKCQCNY